MKAWGWYVDGKWSAYLEILPHLFGQVAFNTVHHKFYKLYSEDRQIQIRWKTQPYPIQHSHALSFRICYIFILYTGSLCLESCKNSAVSAGTCTRVDDLTRGCVFDRGRDVKQQPRFDVRIPLCGYSNVHLSLSVLKCFQRNSYVLFTAHREWSMRLPFYFADFVFMLIIHIVGVCMHKIDKWVESNIQVSRK